MEMTEVQTQIVDLLESIDSLIDWSTFGQEVRKKKYSIYSKRVAAVSRNAKRIEDFVEGLLKDIAGDQLFVTREKSKNLHDVLRTLEQNEEEVLEYLRKYPYLSVVLLGSRIKEKDEEPEVEEAI
jgi:hypothetical protein